MLNEDFWPCLYVDISDFLSDFTKYNVANCVVVNKDFYNNSKICLSGVLWQLSYNTYTSEFFVIFKYCRFVDDDLSIIGLGDCSGSVVCDSNCSPLFYNLLLNKSISSLYFSNCDEFYFVIKDGKLHSVGHMLFLDRDEVLKHVTK